MQSGQLRRRDFGISLLGGALALPLTVLGHAAGKGRLRGLSTWSLEARA